MHSRSARFLTFPIVSFGLFVASPFVLYFSGLYRLSLESEWVHALVHVHFVVGRLSVLLAPDRARSAAGAAGLSAPGPADVPRGAVPHRARPHRDAKRRAVGRRLVSVAALSWADPAADQRLAGGILWAGGEFVAVAMLGALVYQWMRDSEREARRVDRALDRAEAEQAADGRLRRRRRPAGRAGVGTIGGQRRGGDTLNTTDTDAVRTSTVLLYSDDPRVRERMRLAIGERPAADIAVQFIEANAYDEVLRHVDAGEVDLLGARRRGAPPGGRSRHRTAVAR